MFSPADGTLVFATDNVERMRINSSGNIGIGTLTPSQLFQVTGTNAGILVGDSGSSAGALYFGNTAHGVKRNYNNVANDVGLYTAAANLQFSANGSATTQMTLTNAGNLGIGVSPTSKLDVAGTFELGTNGSQLNAMIKVAPTVDIVSIAASACLAQTFAVANATL